MKKLVIIGASGQGKVVADIALLNGYDEIVFLDDNPAVKTVGEYAVVGTTTDIKRLLKGNYEFIIGIGNAAIRRKLQEMLLEEGCNVASLIHPSAVVDKSVDIGEGTVLMAGAVISAGTTIGADCIINTCSSIAPNCMIGDYVHISVGTRVGTGVNIGNESWLGIGAKVANNV